jgi:hypothetical protein
VWKVENRSYRPIKSHPVISQNTWTTLQTLQTVQQVGCCSYVVSPFLWRPVGTATTSSNTLRDWMSTDNTSSVLFIFCLHRNEVASWKLYLMLNSILLYLFSLSLGWSICWLLHPCLPLLRLRTCSREVLNALIYKGPSAGGQPCSCKVVTPDLSKQLEKFLAQNRCV